MDMNIDMLLMVYIVIYSITTNKIGFSKPFLTLYSKLCNKKNKPI